MEKALVLHEKVMKLLIRRYVTAEQRRRDDFGITEDDIIEVRQDISSLRFELLEIFQNNNYNVPDIEKKTAAGRQAINTLAGHPNIICRLIRISQLNLKFKTNS